jgi:uncharacterized protein YceH (UPF0502 family)
MSITLLPEEARVLGCLIEKEITTPEYYPLTVKGLTSACNQKSNRDPVMTMESEEILRALHGLRGKGLAWEVSLAGSRAMKYRYDLSKYYRFSRPQLAVMCELLLRGPQTPGELRSRASRMFPFGDLREVESAVNELETWADGPLVRKLPREPGRRECRYAHLLGTDSVSRDEEPEPETPARSPVPDTGPPSEPVAALREELAALRADVDGLKREFTQFLRQFE